MEKDLDDVSARTPLRAEGSIIVVGNDRREVTPPQQQVDVKFANICYSVSDSKGKSREILRDVTGEFRSGHLTAILGPSGAGKTTLLNLLASHGIRQAKSSLKGSLRLNGASCCEHPELFRNLKVCYVPQEFALMPLLTTGEAIHIAARLQLPASTHDAEARKSIIQEVARRLGLLDCMDTLTNRLSGGERKRLSIAVEMITSPTVLLLDEPTSGLDSASSGQVINLLYSMARTGCTVVCAVHQPSSQMTFCFDDMLIMSQGRCRYCGPRDRILEFFKDAGFACPPFYNLAEFVLEVVTGQRGGNYEQLSSNNSSEYKNADDFKCRSTPSSDSGSSTKSLPKRYAVSQLVQMWVLIYRAFLLIFRDRTLTYLRLSAHLVVGVLIGIVFYDFGSDAKTAQSNIACLFFFAIFLFFASSMPAVQMFPTEATVFLRENKNNWYSLEAYYITKVLSDLPLQILCPTAFLASAYCMTGQPMEFSRFFQVWLICSLFTMLAQSFGIVTGAAFDTHTGAFLIPALNIPMLLFAGFFLKLQEIPYYLQFFSSISYFRYAFEGILQAVYVDRPKFPCRAEYCYHRDWRSILNDLDMPSVSFTTTLIALVIWIAVLHIFTYGTLRFKLYLAKK